MPKYRYQSNGSLCCSSPLLLWGSHRCPHSEEALTQTDFLSSHRWGHKSQNNWSNPSTSPSCSQLQSQMINQEPLIPQWVSPMGEPIVDKSKSYIFCVNRITWTNARVAAFTLYLIICAKVSPFLSPTSYSSSTAARTVTPNTPGPVASNYKNRENIMA